MPKHRVNPEQLTKPRRQTNGDHVRFRRTKQFIGGISLLVAAGAGVTAAATETVNLNHKLNLSTEEATPSDALPNAFDALIIAGAAGGAAVAGARGVHHIRRARNPRLDAIHRIAHAQPDGKNTFPRKASRAVFSVSMLSVGTAMVLGNYKDVADEISTSQVDASESMFEAADEILETNGRINIISNTPKPELANDTGVGQPIAEEFMQRADEYDITAIPARRGWHSIQRIDDPEINIQALAFSVPAEYTGLPEANEDCTDIQVAAPKELGIDIGGQFTMDGRVLTVNRYLDEEQSPGYNLIPLMINNEAYECIFASENQPYNMILANGTPEQVDQILQEMKEEDRNSLAKRLFNVEEQEYLSKTLETGKNSGNSLLFQAMGLAMIYAGAAISNDARNKMEKERPNVTAAIMSGVRKRDIASIYYEQAASKATSTLAPAFIGVIALDYMVNSGAPGAGAAPDAKTALFMGGLSFLAHRVAMGVALRRELPKAVPGEGEK